MRIVLETRSCHLRMLHFCGAATNLFPRDQQGLYNESRRLHALHVKGEFNILTTETFIPWIKQRRREILECVTKEAIEETEESENTFKAMRESIRFLNEKVNRYAAAKQSLSLVMR